MIVSRPKVLLGSASLLLGFVSGCAVQQKQVMQGLQDPPPINCQTADGDLRVLEGEKAHVAQRIVEGATAIYPASVVMSLVMGVERTKISVATGEYNKAIDARIAEIKRTCGI